MKRRFSLFTYPMMDMKAAEAELNRRAAAGWQLEKVWMGVLAVFVPAHEIGRASCRERVFPLV